MPKIEEILDEIEKAYPEDVFPETTQEERAEIIEKYPGFIDRTSAGMGRHLAGIIREKLGEDLRSDQGNLIIVLNGGLEHYAEGYIDQLAERLDAAAVGQGFSRAETEKRQDRVIFIYRQFAYPLGKTGV